MAHPFKHAESSARKFGGKAEDYLAIHNWFDESKSFFTDFRHRALRHHAEGIFLVRAHLRCRNHQQRRQTGASALHRRTARARGSGAHTHRPRLAVANQARPLDVRSAS